MVLAAAPYSKPRHAFTYPIHAVGQAYRTCADVDVRNMEEEIEEGAALRVCDLGSSPILSSISFLLRKDC